MLTSMKDFVGQTVEVGDHIFYSTTGRYSESRVCEVVRFTAKSMIVKILMASRVQSSLANPDVVVRNVFIKIDYTP